MWSALWARMGIPVTRCHPSSECVCVYLCMRACMCVYMCICRIHVCVGSRGSRTLSCSFNLSFLIIMQARPMHFPDRRDKTALDCSPVWQPPCLPLPILPHMGWGHQENCLGYYRPPRGPKSWTPRSGGICCSHHSSWGRLYGASLGKRAGIPFLFCHHSVPPRARTGGHSGNQTWSIATLVLGVQKLETFPSGSQLGELGWG